MWLEETYDVAACSEWVEVATRVQGEMRDKLARQMKRQFDVVLIPDRYILLTTPTHIYGSVL